MLRNVLTQLGWHTLRLEAGKFAWKIKVLLITTKTNIEDQGIQNIIDKLCIAVWILSSAHNSQFASQQLNFTKGHYEINDRALNKLHGDISKLQV